DTYEEDEFERGTRDHDDINPSNFSSPGRGKKGTRGGHKTCEASAWTMAERVRGLRTLKRLSKSNREVAELRQLLEEGVAPEAPQLWGATMGQPDMGEDKDDVLAHNLLLRWRPQPGCAVAFFSLEMSAPGDGKAFRQGAYREVFRDPPNADGEPQYQLWVEGLKPNTPYRFRLRGFNGFGPGPYAHTTVATRPAAPHPPVCAWVAPTEALLRWVFKTKHATKLRELRQAFDAADRDSNGKVSRQELLEALDLDYSHIMSFLKAVSVSEGAEAGAGRRASGGVLGGVRGHPTLSVFDAIETNDDEFITWEEGKGKGKGAHYVMEMCTKEEDDLWKEVWKGTAGEARMKMLEPGRGYRFRLRAYNCQGRSGPASESVVVNTLLETPVMPKVAGGMGKGNTGIWDTKVRLKWARVVPCVGGAGAGIKAGGPVGGGKSSRAQKMLSQWAKNPAEDVGVSLDKIFSRYDQDGSDAIDPLEARLGNLLEDLGVEVTEERLRQAFSDFDRDENGRITLDEFEEWWTGEAITYVLKRDEGISQAILEVTGGDPPASAAVSIASYKGGGTGCDVAGLKPNTLYRFRLRAVNARTRSALSAPLEVMTAPRQPESPVVVRTQRSSVVLKWYPGVGGSAKYRLQSRWVEALDGAGALSGRPHGHGTGKGASGGLGGGTRKAWGEGEGWTTVYEGVDNTVKVTGLQMNTVYRFRVCAINLRGVDSEWSAPSQAATDPRHGVGGGTEGKNGWCRPSNAAEAFRVDAGDDIAVGDTIIFTERLYLDSEGRLAPGLRGCGRGTIHTTPLGPACQGAGLAPRVSLNAASLRSDGGPAGNQWGLEGGEFVGERTVAAHVLQDSLRSMRRKDGARLTYNKAISRRRVLRLEVVWSTVSNKEANAFLLSREQIVERAEWRLSQFETFRALWEHDERRKSVREEWDLLGG
ncbi:unnamed protein product, partial [Discosporangium mesarthrocarpum]